ncbi:MAG: hypothetical protein U0517_00890 [Candidatus Andersenbacteria bacterium]
MEPTHVSALEALVSSAYKKATKKPQRPAGKALRLDVGGVTEAARSYLIAGTPSLRRGPVLIVTSDNEHAQIWENELRFWLKRLNTDTKSGDGAQATADPLVIRYDELPESEQLSQVPSLRRYKNLGVSGRMLANEWAFLSCRCVDLSSDSRRSSALRP